MDEALEIINEMDEECRKLGLPPISRIVEGIPGRPDATAEERAEVYAAAEAGKYDALQTKIEEAGNALVRLGFTDTVH